MMKTLSGYKSSGRPPSRDGSESITPFVRRRYLHDRSTESRHINSQGVLDPFSGSIEVETTIRIERCCCREGQKVCSRIRCVFTAASNSCGILRPLW